LKRNKKTYLINKPKNKYNMKKTTPSKLNLKYVLDYLCKNKITSKRKIEKILKEYNCNYNDFLNNKYVKYNEDMIKKIMNETYLGPNIFNYILSGGKKNRKKYFFGFFYNSMIYESDPELKSLHRYFETACDTMKKYVEKYSYEPYCYWFVELIELKN